jgi:hypothetical protein
VSPPATAAGPADTLDLLADIVDLLAATSVLPAATVDRPPATVDLPAETVDLPPATVDLPPAIDDLPAHTVDLPPEIVDGCWGAGVLRPLPVAVGADSGDGDPNRRRVVGGCAGFLLHAGGPAGPGGVIGCRSGR